ncbi:tyrosinase family protein [Candidatus Halocynthiibacter alkanivorans]|uniref:tyrosinase family protein n=1 Tax=Candidatus Halocynthiibacter alkanivorans TaxID=2267619 RepID=UPI000DF443BC|nr:tyrosinase family protein [Candidatus Halocynthiibacter alkanivorans]
MTSAQTIGVRRSVQDLQQDYDNGIKQPLEDVVRAWKGIKELSPDDPRSFFMLAGYHGEPFDLRPAVDKLTETDIYSYWGGYCNHGNVLFPTWHRVYVKKVEEALQSIVPGVMMPYWDETDAASLACGIPDVLTAEQFLLDGELIDNPLKSYTLPEELKDDYWGDNQNGEHAPYYKPAGYETVRYPLSGLVGNPKDLAKTKAHNSDYPDPAERVSLLNDNVMTWLHGGDPTPENPDPHGVGIYAKFIDCLRAPNYTVFSNVTSAGAWNSASQPYAVPLESPHNDIHLSVGGFDLPYPQFGGEGSTSGQVAGANGDMGENNTAALDPIFFFHHCNVDRMFWLWQKRNPDLKVEIISGYAGTNSSDSQGPTPGVAPDTPLTTSSPLAPFRKANSQEYYSSEDCIDTENQLGYTYGPGSLEELPDQAQTKSTGDVLTVTGVNRAHLQGSFIITALARIGDRVEFLGYESVLSRWNVDGCANCQTHLDVSAHFPLDMLSNSEIASATFEATISHRGESLPASVQLELSVND